MSKDPFARTWEKRDAIKWSRLEGVKGLKGKYSILAKEAVQSSIQQLRSLLANGTTGQEQDISDLSEDQVRDLLGHICSDNRTITLIWTFDKQGIQIKCRDFALYYDDLWYPARDDLWILDDSRDWAIELNHEEIFGLITREENRKS